MSLETIYEIRTILGGKLANRIFADSPHELYAAFKAIDPLIRTYIFKTLKDSNGTVISSNKLNCKIFHNSFIVKTLYDKPRKSLKDSDKGKFRPLPEQVFDIPSLEKLLPIRKMAVTAIERRAEHKLERIPKSPELLSVPKRPSTVSAVPSLREGLKVSSKLSEGGVRGFTGTSEISRRSDLRNAGVSQKPRNIRPASAAVTGREIPPRKITTSTSRRPVNNSQVGSSSRPNIPRRRS